MATVRQVLDDARAFLMAGSEDEINFLDGAYSAGGTTLTMDLPLGGIQRGARLGVDLEEFLVRSVNGQIATVKPAMNGSTGANHADDAIVRVNPKVSDFRLFRHLNDELRGLSSRGLVKVSQLNITATGATTGYDLTGTTTVLDIRAVKREQAGSSKNWPTLRRHEFRLDTGQDTTEFASGNSLMVYSGVDVGQKIRVWYDEPLTAVTAVGDDLTTVAGLHAEAHDILSIGIARRAMAGLPIRRAAFDAQGDPRRAEEASTGDVLNSPSRLTALYESRIEEEVARLERRFPRTL